MVEKFLLTITVLMLQIFATKSLLRPATGRIGRRPPSSWRSTSTIHRDGAAPRKSTRARRKEKELISASVPGTLEWESFDFSQSPKWDKRFDEEGSDFHLASSDEDWEQIRRDEAIQDELMQKRFDRQHKRWDELDPQLIEDATNVLRPYVLPERMERIESIMAKRTQQTRFLFENPANPSNVWACLRTIDSFGIQHVDVVVQSGRYKGKAALTQKRGMRTAMGSAKWLTIKNHLSPKMALKAIKDEGYHIMCTDVNPDSKDIREVDWDASGKKVCIVMGNEQEGISDDVREMADESFYLPMTGMAESFNLSVATAITCAHLSAASCGKEGTGPLRAGDLSEKEYKTLILKGCMNSMKHQMAQGLFRRNGISFPKDMNLS